MLLPGCWWYLPTEEDWVLHKCEIWINYMRIWHQGNYMSHIIYYIYSNIYYIIYIYIYSCSYIYTNMYHIYIYTKWPLCSKVNAAKQSLNSNQHKGHGWVPGIYLYVFSLHRLILPSKCRNKWQVLPMPLPISKGVPSTRFWRYSRERRCRALQPSKTLKQATKT